MKLITGGTGFVGIALARRLLSMGEKVRLMSRHKTSEIPKGAEFFQGDVSNCDMVRRAVKGVDTIFHLAALIPQRLADKVTMKAVNVGGTENILKSAVEEGVKKVVFMSSVEVYGVPAENPCPENAPLNAINEYGFNKIEAEKLCIKYFKDKRLDVSILRPPGITGVRQYEPFLVGLMEAAIKGKPLMLIGKGTNVWQMLDIEDTIDACLLCTQVKKSAGKIFNIGTEDICSLNEYYQAIIDRAGTGSKIKHVNATFTKMLFSILAIFKKAPITPPQLKMILSDYVFDISKAKKMLGWKPKKGNIESAIESYDYFKEHYKGNVKK